MKVTIFVGVGQCITGLFVGIGGIIEEVTCASPAATVIRAVRSFNVVFIHVKDADDKPPSAERCWSN